MPDRTAGGQPPPRPQVTARQSAINMLAFARDSGGLDGERAAVAYSLMHVGDQLARIADTLERGSADDAARATISVVDGVQSPPSPPRCTSMTNVTDGAGGTYPVQCALPAGHPGQHGNNPHTWPAEPPYRLTPPGPDTRCDAVISIPNEDPESLALQTVQCALLAGHDGTHMSVDLRTWNDNPDQTTESHIA